MLTDYKNDLFATHADMGAALAYVNTLCSAACTGTDSISIRTAAHVILNTSIELHRAEKKVLIDKINEMSARANPVTALMSLVREQVSLAVAEQNHALTAAVNEQIGNQIENWAADHFADRADDWYGNNVDMGEAIEQHIEHNMNIGETIAEQISNYFGNNTFSIEPR
jgi:hypothetical protein